MATTKHRELRKKIKLEKCPFCGFAHPHADKWRDTDDSPLVYVIDCPDCGASGPIMGGNPDRARAAWNHRGGPVETFTLEARGVPEAIPDDVTDEPEEPAHALEAEGELTRVNGPVPCPWCNSLDIMIGSGEIRRGKLREPYFYAYCENCEGCGPAHDTTDGFATLAWNRRSSS